jgi:hypothetical protein
MLRYTLAFCLILLGSSSFAETFKCARAGGASYYSDVPCGTDKTVLVEKTLASSASTQPNQKQTGKLFELCKAAIKDWIPYKDPATFIYRDGNRPAVRNVEIKDPKGIPQPAIRINMEANSRTSSNRYGSTEYYYCYVTPSDTASVIGIYTQPME